MSPRPAFKKPKSTGPKIRVRNVTQGGRTYQYFVVDLGKVDGKRKFRNFKTKREAEAFVSNQKQHERHVGEGARGLTKEQLWDALQALDKAQGSVTLTSAVERALALPLDIHDDAVSASSILGSLATLTEAAQYFVTHRNPTGGKRRHGPSSTTFRHRFTKALMEGITWRGTGELGPSPPERPTRTTGLGPTSSRTSATSRDHRGA